MAFSRLKSVAKGQENDKYDFHLRKSKVEWIMNMQQERRRRLKIGCSTKVTKCGFGSNHQTSQVMHGFQVPYHRSCLPYRVGFWVGPLGYSGPISFWGSFLAIFSHFLNGPGANKTWDIIQTQNQLWKHSWWTVQKWKKNLKIFGPIFEYAQKWGFPLNEKMTPRVGVKPKKLPTIRKLIL